jgi:hypothetical protein
LLDVDFKDDCADRPRRKFVGSGRNDLREIGMSVAHVEQFIKRAMTDAAMLQRLSAGAGSLDTYVALCVKEAKTLGYDFTAAEATEYVKQFVETAKKGELSDVQLELVAGGKLSPGGGLGGGVGGYTPPPAGGAGHPPGYTGGKHPIGGGGSGGGGGSPPPSYPPVGLPPGGVGGKRRP